MMDYQKYLQTVGDVAVQVSTPAEALQLCEWVDATIPDASGTDMETHYALLSAVVVYWKRHGAYEDMLCPILSVLHALQALQPDENNLAHIVRIQSLNDEMLNTDPCDEYEPCSYEEFCDKYADELNR